MTSPHEPSPTRGGDCLVTGATGLLGNTIVRQLVGAGRPARALVRGAAPDGGPPLADLGVRVVPGRLEDERSLQDAADGTTSVIHAAALVHVGWHRAEEMRRVNVDGTRRVAAAARRAGARLVHVSSVDAIGLAADGTPADEDTPPGGMPPCPYVCTKRDAEAAVLEEVERGLDAVIVNPVYMIGPWDWKPSSGRMLLQVAAGRGLFAPPGANDFVDARDVAAGVVAALDRGRCGRRYILGGHGLGYLDAWRIFARVTGRRPPLGVAPRAAVRAAGWCGDLAGRFLRREPDVNSAATAMALLPHNFSCARAVRELGYGYRPLEETARDAWAWFQAHGYAGRAPRRG
jgi:dihydroflavonol-4-reductase